MSARDLERRAAAGDKAAQLELADALDVAGRHQDAISVLSVAAHSGNADAKARVGVRLLIGDRAPLMPPQGAGLVEDAAKEGSGEAASVLASLAAAGAYRRQSWSEAFDWLARAAERGRASARAQLALLTPDAQLAAEARSDEPPVDLWRRLRASIDIAALLAAPAGVTLNEAPLIRRFPSFVSPAVCDWLAARAAERLKRAEIYAGGPAQTAVSGVRTNSIRVFTLAETDLVQLVLQARMGAATGTATYNMEAPAVLHYSPGQEFRDHYDFIDPETPNYRALIARDGERLVTFLVYLNDDYEGGETAFPRLGISHKGARGEGLFFTNALPDGAPDLRALHAGRPPTRGDKWIVSQFIRSKRQLPGA